MAIKEVGIKEAVIMEVDTREAETMEVSEETLIEEVVEEEEAIKIRRPKEAGLSGRTITLNIKDLEALLPRLNNHLLTG